MSTYKRTSWKLIKSLLIVPLPPVAAGVFLLWLLQYFPYNWMFAITIAVPALILLGLLYSAIWGENIRFEITDEGRCDYYQNGKLKNHFDLRTCNVSYYHSKDANGGTNRMSLHLTEESGEEHSIDCEPIGEKQFNIMVRQMQEFSMIEPERLTSRNKL